MKEFPLVALIPKRIAPMRCLFLLFAAVLSLGSCVNCRADQISVLEQFNRNYFGGHTIRVQSDSNGISVTLPEWDFDTDYRSIAVPALPQGARVTGATFSLFPDDGISRITSPGVMEGSVPANLNFINVYGLGFGPCDPGTCAPTLLNMSMHYTYGFADQCVSWTDVCFQSAPVNGNTDLLSLGLSPSYFADGFTIQTAGEPADILGCCHSFTVDQILFPGFNSITDYAFHGIGPLFAEEVNVSYTLATPEPSTWLYALAAVLVLVAVKWKALRRQFQ
jgi:hypothetical protein